MAKTTWGRKETIIWPPRQPIYTIGALFLALVVTGLFVYLRFQFGLELRAGIPVLRQAKCVALGDFPFRIFSVVFQNDE